MYSFLVLTDGIPVPITEEDVMNSPEKDKWIKAMDVEKAKIDKYDTYALVELPVTADGKTPNVIKSRWV
jgi:hypothetical protein